MSMSHEPAIGEGERELGEQRILSSSLDSLNVKLVGQNDPLQRYLSNKLGFLVITCKLVGLSYQYSRNFVGPILPNPTDGKAQSTTNRITVNEDQISYFLNNADDSATANFQRWCSQSTNESESSPSSFYRQLYHVNDVRSQIT